jgi:hypothetical protein
MSREDLQDKMEQSDREVQVSVRCAKCGEPVKPNESHQCKGEEKKDEN